MTGKGPPRSGWVMRSWVAVLVAISICWSIMAIVTRFDDAGYFGAFLGLSDRFARNHGMTRRAGFPVGAGLNLSDGIALLQSTLPRFLFISFAAGVFAMTQTTNRFFSTKLPPDDDAAGRGARCEARVRHGGAQPGRKILRDLDVSSARSSGRKDMARLAREENEALKVRHRGSSGRQAPRISPSKVRRPPCRPARGTGGWDRLRFRWEAPSLTCR